MSEEFFDYENQEPKNPLIAFLLISSCIFVVAVCAFLSWMFIVTRDNETNRKINQSKYVDVQNTRKAEDAVLNGYQYLDKDKGVVRIPVERAMQLMVEEAKAAPKVPNAEAATALPAAWTAAAKPSNTPAAAKPAAPVVKGAAAGQKK
jgi:hypothetical protein